MTKTDFSSPHFLSLSALFLKALCMNRLILVFLQFLHKVYYDFHDMSGMHLENLALFAYDQICFCMSPLENIYPRHHSVRKLLSFGFI